jgi:hypothetical protein
VKEKYFLQKYCHIGDVGIEKQPIHIVVMHQTALAMTQYKFTMLIQTESMMMVPIIVHPGQ